MIKAFKDLFGKASGQEKKLINRREALTKASCIALSATTMMVLMKSQPAKAQSAPLKSAPIARQTESYTRTTRN
jgi:hypothetical protein